MKAIKMALAALVLVSPASADVPKGEIMGLWSGTVESDDNTDAFLLLDFYESTTSDGMTVGNVLVKFGRHPRPRSLSFFVGNDVIVVQNPYQADRPTFLTGLKVSKGVLSGNW